MSSELDPLLGQVIAGRYAVTRRIGQGGMGAVYVARQQQLGRDVALKVIRADLVHQPEIVGRFEREARAIASLQDPHIVVVHDFGHSDGTLFLAMELLSGISLGERLRTEGALPLATALRIARDICAALEVAHDAGVIHRDLKPDNIMLIRADGRSDHVKVLDFGIAKIVGGPEVGLTAPRTVLGTPGYVAPDVIMGGMTDDPRADLYAVGIMLFEMLAGRAPFQASSPGALLVFQATDDPPLLSTIVANAPASVVELIRRLTAKKPENRPASARATITAIDDIVAGLGAVPGTSTIPLSLLAGNVAISQKNVPTTLTPAVKATHTPATSMSLPTVPPKKTVPLGFAAAAVLATVAVAAAVVVLTRGAPAPVVAVTTPTAPVAIVPPPPPAIVAAPVPAIEAVEPTPAVVEPAPAPEPPKPTKVAAATMPTTKVKPVEVKPAGPPRLTSALIKDNIVKSVGKASACTNTNIKLAPSGPGLFIDHCPSYKTVDGAHQVVFTLAPDGTVLDARFDDDATNQTSIGKCVLASLKTWHFDVFEGSEPVKINQKITFEPCVPINNKCVF